MIVPILFTLASRMVLRSVHLVPGFLTLWVNQPGREDDHSLLSIANIKNAWSYTSTPLLTTGWTIGVKFAAGKIMEFFLFALASRSYLWPTQPPIQWVPGILISGVKRLELEADNFPPCIAECVKLYLHYPISVHGVMLS
jgi:hypothetical protein